MWRYTVALALLLTLGCLEEGEVSPEDIPSGAPDITRFDGEWLSEEFAYAIQISGRLGTVTISNTDANPVGELILVIQTDEGPQFSGLHVFRRGSVEEVVGRLVDPNTIRMTGGGITWNMMRISNAAPVAVAGMNTSTVGGELVTLDASDSMDPDFDDEITYSWTQEAGDAVTLSADSAPVVTFVAPLEAQLLTFRVTVTDLAMASDQDQVTVTVTGPPDP